MDQSESKYRTLFEMIDEGYCIIEMLYDPKGEPQAHRATTDTSEEHA